MNSNDIICAVGDSFIFGAELVTQYHRKEFDDIKNYHQLEFEVHPDSAARDKYFRLLDRYRFSSLVAGDLGRGHINFSVGGASQEGIKLQTYALMQHLKENGIRPEFTTWVVGLTMDTRKYMPQDQHPHYFKLKVDAVNGDENWVWSRTTSSTFFCDRISQPIEAYSSEFTKEAINATSVTNINLTWLMNILDTVHILKAAKVKQIILVNMFHNRNQLDFTPAAGQPDTACLSYCRKLSEEYRELVVPHTSKSFNELNASLEKLPHGHPSKEGHRSIADYITKRIRENEMVLLYKEIGEDNIPLSNNRLINGGRCPSFTWEIFKSSAVEKITDDLPGYNYGFVVQFDYEEYFRENSLVEYFEKRDIIPDSVRTLIKHNRCKLFYDVIYEGHVENKDFDQFYALTKYYEFPNSQVYYVTAALGAQDIHRAYCKERGITDPIRIITFPLFEVFIKRHLSYSNISKKSHPIEKKFICLNRSPRPHRAFITTYILNNPSLLDNFYYSFLGEDGYHKYTFEEATKHVLRGCKKIPIEDADIDAAGKLLPLHLDPTPAVTFDNIGSEVEYYYDRSLFNVTTESHFFEGMQYGYSTLFLTEKCFKPFMYGQIPIIFGPPNIINKLREMKYDVFDDIVDHGYDLVINHEARFNAVIKEIHRINDKYSLKDCDVLNTSLAARFRNNLNIITAPFTALPEWRHIITHG